MRRGRGRGRVRVEEAHGVAICGDVLRGRRQRRQLVGDDGGNLGIEHRLVLGGLTLGAKLAVVVDRLEEGVHYRGRRGRSRIY